MATLTINGRRVKVDDSFLSLSPEQQNATVDEIAQSLGGQQEPQRSDAYNQASSEMSAMTQALDKPKAPDPYKDGAFMASTEGSHAGLMGGFDDEITAGMLAPVDATIDWFKGDGFDMGRAYTRKQKMLDERKQARRDEHPIASIGGELAGGLALGAGAAKAGLTFAGKPAASLIGNIGRGAAEGTAYGALYGAGEAKPGERISGAGTGAAIGGLTGGALGAVGGALGRNSAKKALPVAPTADDVAAQAQALYRASEAQGVTFSQPAIKRLSDNLKYSAGRINDRLRPMTAGFMDDVDAMAGGNMTLEAFDEFRKSLNQSINKAMPDDARTLSAMKRIVDGFADNISPSEMTGGAPGLEMLKSARQMWSRAKKAEVIEKVMDVADVQTGQYTQSGLANTITREMRALYKQIVKGKSGHAWTKEEIALIRQMASGGSSSRLVNLFAKFAPRGVVSIIGGQAAGSFLPGVGNVAVPLLGHVAGEAADRAAIQAAQTLRSGAATGVIPRFPAVGNKLAPLIPGMTSPSMGTGRSLAR